MTWANKRTDRHRFPVLQPLGTGWHWGQPEALLCPQSPPKAQTAFLLGITPLSLRCGVSLNCLGTGTAPKNTTATTGHL